MSVSVANRRGTNLTLFVKKIQASFWDDGPTVKQGPLQPVISLHGYCPPSLGADSEFW